MIFQEPSILPKHTCSAMYLLKNGAMAFGVGGSGPAMFSMCIGKEVAEQVEVNLKDLYKNSNIQIDSFVSKVSNVGSKIIS